MKTFYMFEFLTIIGLVMPIILARKIGLSNIFQHIQEPEISGPIRQSTVKVEYVEQRLDNFDPMNNITWKMRYLRNDEFYKSGGPIFIYVGGEWTIQPDSLRAGYMCDMAELLGGQLFYTEHRFYGSSLPTLDASVENFRFLNVEQGLADLAYFIVHIRQRHPEYHNSRVILVGGSFGATMIVWFRQHYPHLAAGAWASGGPINVKLDFIEYTKAVGESIRNVSKECYHRIDKAFTQAENLVENRKFIEISNIFKICNEISDQKPYDIMGLFAMFLNLFASLVENHRPGIIEKACGSILTSTNPLETDLQAVARWITNKIFQTDETNDCLDISYENYIAIHRNTSWHSYAAYISRRQWNYQLCAEFGWYHTTGSKFQPFGSSVPLEFYIQRCKDVYGEMFSNHSISINVQRKNAMYGGFSPNVQNVYFTYGQFDPWRTMGLESDLNEFSPVDIIPDSSHCHELSSSTPNDHPKLHEVHERILKLVKSWSGLVR